MGEVANDTNAGDGHGDSTVSGFHFDSNRYLVLLTLLRANNERTIDR
jgi:hypothetical protein